MIGRLDSYRIFHAVSRNRSFSKAARELYMTQSAVSQAISKLEKDLEVQLFYRTSKGVVLTNEGKLLNEHVHSALRIIDAAEDKIVESKMLKAGQLRIAVGDAIARYFLLPHLEYFHFRYPGVKLIILNGTTAEICDAIKSGAADVGMINLPVQDEQLTIIPCKEIRDIFVCGEKYKRITRRPVSLNELTKLPLIFLEEKSNTRAYVDQFLETKGVKVSPVFELGSHDLVLEFARINLGVSCVIKEFSKNYLERGDLVEVVLEEAIPPRSIGICYLKHVPLSRAAKTFTDTILFRS
jgi:DNA-binding transcriptional LysR family regulator